MKLSNKLSIVDVFMETCGVISKDEKSIFEMAGITLALSLLAVFLAYGITKIATGTFTEIFYIFVLSILSLIVWAIPSIALSRYILLDEPLSKDLFLKWNYRHTRWIMFGALFVFISIFIIYACPLYVLSLVKSQTGKMILNFFVLFICLPIAVYLHARFFLNSQVIAIDILENPLKHSWRKSSGNGWKLAFLRYQILLPISLVSFDDSMPINLFLREIVSFPFIFFGSIAFAVAYKKITAKEG